jgi:hypothetical protein
MDWYKSNIVAAREEAVHVCGAEGRGTYYTHKGAHFQILFVSCRTLLVVEFVFPSVTGSKPSVHFLIVSPPFIPSASSASATA